MNNNKKVFIDANVFVYFIDETAAQHEDTLFTLQRLVDEDTRLYTSHHVVEEVLHIISRLTPDKSAVLIAAQTIASLPRLNLVEPEANFTFVNRYLDLWESANIGINDNLLMQLMLDASIPCLLTFDIPFIKQALKQGVTILSPGLEPTPYLEDIMRKSDADIKAGRNISKTYSSVDDFFRDLD